MKVRVPKLMALSLTSLQFAQMLVGILVNVYSVHVMSKRTRIKNYYLI